MLKEEKLAQDNKQTQTAQSAAQQSAQEYLDMQRVLHEINIELFRIDDLDELYRTAVELAHTQLGFERVGLYLLNESNDLLLGTYGTDAEGNICKEQGPEYVIDQKETIDTFVLGRNRLVVDEDTDLWSGGEVVGRGWHISAAMWIEDAPIGVIFADNLLTGQPLKPYQSELLFAYASIVSNLIERNRFETIITKRAAEMQVVAEVGTAVATILDTDKLLQEVVNLTKNRFDLYHAHIYLLDTETETLDLISGAGTVGRQMVSEGRQIPLKQEQSLVARAARSRQGVVINDVQADPGFLPHPLLPDTRAEMAVPMITGEQVLGVLDVQSNRLNYFSKEDINTFTTLAAQMAVALQNARLFTQSEERATELAFINKVVAEVSASLDIEQSLQIVADELAKVVDLDGIGIALLNDDKTYLTVVAEHYSSEKAVSILGYTYPVAGNPVTQKAFSTRNTVLVEDAQNHPLTEPIHAGLRMRGVNTMYVIPMFAGNEIVGTVGFDSKEKGQLSPQQLRLAETIVYQAATAVQNARLFAQVQTSLRSTEQSEQFLTSLINTIPNPIFYKDADGVYIGMNQAFLELLGVQSDDLLGKSVFDLQTDEALAQEYHQMDVDLFESPDEPQIYESQITDASGQLRDVIFNKNVFYQADGSLGGLVGVIVDITERKKSEEALRRSEAELSQALRIAQLGYWEYDVEKDLFTFNDQFYALFHTTAEEHGGYQLSSAYYAQHFVHPDDVSLVGAEIERALNSTDQHFSRSLEHRILYADGSVGYFSVNINLERDEHGKILRWYGANQDITERIRAEEALRHSEANLTQALKIAKLAYWEYDVENDLFTFNDQFYTLFHTTAEEHGGYQLPSAYYAQHFVYPDDLPIVGAEIERALNSTDQHYSRSLEHRILYVDGGVGYISVSINIDRDEQGNILRYYGANQDITDLKLAEQELQAAHKRTQEILESIYIPLGISNVSDGKIVYVNEPMAEMFRVSREELQSWVISDIYHEASDRDGYVKALREQGYVSNFELYLKRGDGEAFWALASGRIVDFQGQPAVITSAIDITARREAQEIIARRATELETVANVSAVAATILEPEELLQQVVDLTKERFDLYHAHIYLLDKGMGQLTLSNGAGDVGRTMVTEGRQIALSRKKSLVARAARDKKGVVINDVRAESGFLPHPLLPETRAEMAVPLLARDEVLGVLDVQADSINRFMEEDINIFTTLAAQIAIALQNARSLNQSEKAVQELQQLSRRLTREGWQEYFTQRKDRLAFSYDQQQEVPVLEAGPEPAAFSEDAKLVTQPLQIQGASVGQLRLEFPEQYGEDESELLTAVTERLSAHLENLRLAEVSEKDRAAAEKRSQEMAVINNIVTQISTSLDLQHSLQIVVDELVTAVNVDQVRVALIQPNKKELLVIAEHYDSARATSAVGMTIPIEGNELTQSVIKTRQTVVVEDAQNNPQTAPVHNLFREQGIETVILMPLIVNDEVIGTLGMDILDNRPVTENSLKLAETIVFQTATAIQNARLFEQIQATLAETEMLYSYSSQLNTATSLDAVLDSAAAAGFQVGATDAVLLVYDRNTTGNPEYAQVAATAPRNEKRVGERLYLQEQPTRYLWPASGQNTVFVSDVATDDRLSPEDKETFAKQKIQALAIMYLNVGNLRLGQILIYWDKVQTFTNADERLYGAVAQQASSVVYNRLLFNQTEEALSETAALYQASADLNTAQTFEEVLTALRQHTILGQGCHNVSINFFDRPWEKNEIPEEIQVMARWETVPSQGPDRYKLIHFPDVNAILKPDELIIFEDIATDDRFTEQGKHILVEQFKANCFVYVPIVAAGQWVGFISGLYSQKVNFSEEQIRRLNVLTRQAAVSLTSIRLYEQTQEALAQTEALYTGSERIILSSTEDEILQSLILSTELRRLDRASLFMFDQPVEDRVACDVTVVATWVNEGVPPSVQVGTRFEVARVPFLSTVNPDESLVINDIRNDSRVDAQTRQILESYGMISFVMVPIVVGSQWLGMVSGQSSVPMNMTEVQMRQANSLVGQAAVVMQTTILFRQEQARARREHLLREIAAKVRSSTDIDTIMQTAVTEIGRTLGRRSFIKLGDGQNGEARAGTGPLSQSQKENGAT